MHKIKTFFLKHYQKFFLLFFFCFLGYVIYIKFLLPVNFMAYENYHGIGYLNKVYGNLFCEFSCYKFSKFLGEGFGNGPNDGLFPTLFFSYLLNTFSLSANSIFMIQSFLSIVSFFFFASVFSLVSKNKILGLFSFILLLTLPHQIKYGHTEDWYILGNFLISLSLYLYTLFFTKKHILCFVLSMLFFVCAVYTRTLYIIYIPVFLFITMLMCSWKDLKWKTITARMYVYFALCVSVLSIVFIFVNNRYQRLVIDDSQHFKDSFAPYKENIWDRIEKLYRVLHYYLAGLVPEIYYILCVLGIGMVVFIKRKYRVVYVLFIIFVFVISDKYIHKGIDSTLVRHFLLLEPLFIFMCSIGMLGIWMFLSSVFKKYMWIRYTMMMIFFGFLLWQPIYFSVPIREQYALQEEYNFLSENISSLGLSFNLVIPARVDKTEYDFPMFLFQKQRALDMLLFNIDRQGHSGLSSFVDNFENLKNKKNIFYLSTACYASGNTQKQDFFRTNCQYMKDHFLLKAIVEKDISAKTYIIPYIVSKTPTIKIGFYEILGKK